MHRSIGLPPPHDATISRRVRCHFGVRTASRFRREEIDFALGRGDDFTRPACRLPRLHYRGVADNFSFATALISPVFAHLYRISITERTDNIEKYDLH